MIKDWYLANFPDDEMGEDINETATFKGLFQTLDSYKSVYSYIGICDSLVRERIFLELASRISTTYEYIFEQWLKCKEC